MVIRQKGAVLVKDPKPKLREQTKKQCTKNRWHNNLVWRMILVGILVLVGIHVSLFKSFVDTVYNPNGDWSALPRNNQTSEPLRRVDDEGHQKQQAGNHQRIRYHQVAKEVERLSKLKSQKTKNNGKVSRQNVDDNRICYETCCVRQVKYNVNYHEKQHQLLSTITGLDLADVAFQWSAAGRTQHNAFVFHEDILPCLQNGTIIHVNNNGKILRYFWNQIRPKMTTTFVLITSDSDADTPHKTETMALRKLDDPLLLKWYGQNPDPLKLLPSGRHDKFVPFPLGLSINHPQAQYLTPYLQLTNHTNPFDEDLQMSFRQDYVVDFDKDVFVFFSPNNKQRQALWKAACVNHANNYSHDELSCRVPTKKLTPHQIYQRATTASSSKNNDSYFYKFGLSPPGIGWDCYRTYEYLYLGLIPIIEARLPQSQFLFEGLPVIQVEQLHTKSKERLTAILQAYVSQPSFRKTTIGSSGWERLFLKYWRQHVLKSANRHLAHDDQQEEYYIGYQYETTKTTEVTYCSKPGNCCPSLESKNCI